MKFSTRLNANIPATQLFDRIADFDRLERNLILNGANVTRIDPVNEPGTGMGWNVAFDWRGRERPMRLEVDRFDRPEILSMSGQTESLSIAILATVISLSPTRSRLLFQMEVKPRNMRARLLMQTAKLGKGRLDRRFEQRVRDFLGDDLEGVV